VARVTTYIHTLKLLGRSGQLPCVPGRSPLHGLVDCQTLTRSMLPRSRRSVQSGDDTWFHLLFKMTQDPLHEKQMCLVTIGVAPATDGIMGSRGIRALTIPCTDRVLRSIPRVQTAEFRPFLHCTNFSWTTGRVAFLGAPSLGEENKRPGLPDVERGETEAQNGESRLQGRVVANCSVLVRELDLGRRDGDVEGERSGMRTAEVRLLIH
jgi:hypothetical protein